MKQINVYADITKWQYGIKHIGMTILLLDKNGRIMLGVDNILNGFPFMVFVLYETLMFREIGNTKTNFVLFSYAGKFLKEQFIRIGVLAAYRAMRKNRKIV